ncbi:hypothetical protein MOMOMM052B1_19505 [Morganella morganii]
MIALAKVAESSIVAVVIKKKLKFHILISYFQKLSLLIKKKLVFRIRNKYELEYGH